MKKLCTQKKTIMVRKTLGQIATVAVLLFSLSSCQKDPVDDGGDTLSPPSSAAYADLKKLADELVNVQFNVEDGLEYTTPKGTVITFGENSLVDENDDDVTGEVELTFVEMYDRGTMVATDNALMGYLEIGSIPGELHAQPLVTGGQFFVEVKQGSKTLKAKPGHPYKLVVDARHTGGIDNEMTMWRLIAVNMAGDPIPGIDITVNQCCPPSNGRIVWDEVDGADRETTWMGADVQLSTYNVFSTEFGWTNIDRFYSDEREKTQIKVFVPNGYDHTNTDVYVAYEDEPGVLAKLDAFDTADKFFSEHYGYLPIGLKVHLIFTSESNGTIVYAIKTVTITANGTFTFYMTDLQTTTKNNLISMINALD